jgi:hypothetical protein
MFTKGQWDKSFIFNSIRLRREWLLWGSHGPLLASVWSTLVRCTGRFLAHENPIFPHRVTFALLRFISFKNLKIFGPKKEINKLK